MTTTKIILASQSPRRDEILSSAGLEHVILTAPADERSVVFVPGAPEDYVIRVSRLKNDAAAAAYPGECVGAALLSADTIVYSPETDEVLGKPHDRADAERMLALLSGRAHLVLTGVTLRLGGKLRSFAEVTEVTFRSLTAEEIADYCATSEPYDKAGAYGIQGRACVFVSGIRGDYFNVVGLPVCRILTELRAMAED